MAHVYIYIYTYIYIYIHMYIQIYMHIHMFMSAGERCTLLHRERWMMTDGRTDRRTDREIDDPSVFSFISAVVQFAFSSLLTTASMFVIALNGSIKRLLYLPIYLSTCRYLPTHLPIYLSTCLPTYLSIYMSFYVPTLSIILIFYLVGVMFCLFFLIQSQL